MCVIEWERENEGVAPLSTSTLEINQNPNFYKWSVSVHILASREQIYKKVKKIRCKSVNIYVYIYI